MEKQTDDAIDALLKQHKSPRPKRKTLVGFGLKSLLALGLPLLVVLLTMPVSGGKPVISLAELSSAKWLKHSKDWLLSLPGKSETTFYRWQDKQGRWHFSEEKPADRALFETVTVSGDIATLPAPTGENANKETSTGFAPLSDQVQNTATVTNQYTKGTENP